MDVGEGLTGNDCHQWACYPSPLLNEELATFPEGPSSVPSTRVREFKTPGAFTTLKGLTLPKALGVCLSHKRSGGEGQLFCVYDRKDAWNPQQCWAWPVA